jgi:hypothetical protein
MMIGAFRLRHRLKSLATTTAVGTGIQFFALTTGCGIVRCSPLPFRRALCIAEAEGDLQVPFVSTADWGYLRLRLPDYADGDLKTWLKRVQEQGWKDAFVFFKHDDEGKGPKMAKSATPPGKVD